RARTRRVAWRGNGSVRRRRGGGGRRGRVVHRDPGARARRRRGGRARAAGRRGRADSDRGRQRRSGGRGGGGAFPCLVWRGQVPAGATRPVSRHAVRTGGRRRRGRGARVPRGRGHRDRCRVAAARRCRRRRAAVRAAGAGPPLPLHRGTDAMTEVLTCGETMAVLRGPGPLRLGGSLELSVAGAESNVAIGLARLGHQAGWVGRVGADEPGELVQRTLRAEGVDVSGVTTDPSRTTGLMLGERRIGDLVRVTYYRSGSAGSRLSPADILPRIGEGVRLLHLTGITAALSDTARQCVTDAAARAREAGVAVSVDVNYRARLWTPAEARATLLPLTGQADIVFASADE